MLTGLVSFLELPFAVRSLEVMILISLTTAPLGFYLNLRRMSLIGDALSHSILPGAAVGYLVGGMSLWSVFIGGLSAGMLVAIVSGAIAQWTQQKEDSSFAVFYLISLAFGVILLTINKSQNDLIHLLFGSVFLIDDSSLWLAAVVLMIVVPCLYIFRRPLLLEGFDPSLLPRFGFSKIGVHLLFLFLVVLGLVSSFQSLGTLLSLGIMVIPAAASRLWTSTIRSGMALTIAFSVVSSCAGILLSLILDWPCGPSVIVCCGGIYLFSVLFSVENGLLTQLSKQKHFEQ